jgi:hypothetical protein
MASLAIAWAYLSFLFVTVTMILRRLVRGRSLTMHGVEGWFSLGRGGSR